jgi:hypothetical protein
MNAAAASGFRTTGGLSGSLRTMSFENTRHIFSAAYAVCAQPVFLAMPISQPQRNLKPAPNQPGNSLASDVCPDMVGNIQPYPLIQRLLRSSKILQNDPA